MIKTVNYSPKFRDSLKRLNLTLRKEAIEELRSFVENPNQAYFNIHQLRKDKKDWLSMSIAPNLRVIFKFTKLDKSEVYFHDIGTHEIYK